MMINRGSRNMHPAISEVPLFFVPEELGVTPGSTIYKNQGLLLEEALKPSETATLEAQRQEILDNVTPEIFAKID